MWASGIRLLIVFPIVIAALLFTLQLLQKHYVPTHKTQQLKLIEQLQLAPKIKIAIVKVGFEYLVLAIQDESVEVIKTLSDDEVSELEAAQQLKGSDMNETVINALSKFKKSN